MTVITADGLIFGHSKLTVDPITAVSKAIYHRLPDVFISLTGSHASESLP